MTAVRDMTAANLDRFWSKVAKTDGCWEWTAGRYKQGYGAFSLRGTMYRSHRIAYELANGPIPAGVELDHRCHNRACVNPNHLRATTTKQNQENQITVRTRSGIRGVYLVRKKWRAQVKHNGKSHYAGNFTEVSDAEAAVIALRNKLFTHNDLDRKTGAAA